MSDSDKSLAEQFTDIIVDFRSIDSPSIEDVSDFATSLDDVLQEAISGGLDDIDMSDSIGLMLSIFTTEGLSQVDHDMFYQRLLDDITDEDLVSDLQNLIYAYLMDLAAANLNSSFVTSETLDFPTSFSAYFFSCVMALFLFDDSGLTQEQRMNAMSQVSSQGGALTAQEDCDAFWDTIASSLSDVDQDLLDSIELHYQMILMMYRDINYSTFETSQFMFKPLIQAIGSLNSIITDEYDFIIKCVTARLDDQEDEFVSGANFLLGLSDFLSEPDITGNYSEEELDSVISTFNSIFQNYSLYAPSTGNTMSLPSKFSTNLTSTFGLYAVDFDSDTASGLLGQYISDIIPVYPEITPEELIEYLGMANDIIIGDSTSQTEIAAFASKATQYFIDEGLDEDVMNTVYTSFISQLNDTHEKFLNDLFATTINEEGYENLPATLQVIVQSLLGTSSDGEYKPVTTISYIIAQTQTVMLTLNNIPANGLSAANFVQMQILFIEYLSNFATQDQLDQYGMLMNSSLENFPAEAEREEEEAALIEMWVEIGIAIALLVVTVVITVFTLGAGSGAAAAVDAAVIGAEVAADAAIEGAEVAGEVITDVVIDTSIEAADSSIEGIELTEISTETGIETAEDVTEDLAGDVEELLDTEPPEAEGMESDIEVDDPDIDSDEAPDAEEEQEEPEEEEAEEEDEDEKEDECVKNFASFIESSAKSGEIVLLISALASDINDLVEEDYASSLEDVSTIISNVSKTLQGLCTESTGETDYSKVIVAIVRNLNNTATAILNDVLSQSEEPLSEDTQIAELTVEYIANVYSIITGLMGIITALQGLAEAAGGTAGASLIASIRINYRNAVVLKNNIESLEKYLEDESDA